ncbi:acid protease [Dendrothele bispora CBS 962.96]|uniref:Acid protease n=1 Tax=Dendrothele bispora (strain CBS 962.96) TaxID=1314807 RepID=A0A4S8LMR7_DENBC|nr:acid protease [Dendrothele bispora CBS 962.96]
MTHSILISLQLAILFLSHTVTAAPAPNDQPVQARAASYSTGGGLTTPLMRRNPRPTQLSEEEWGLWVKNNKAGLINKIINQGADSSFFSTLSIGNLPTSCNVILDTGSSDLWIAGSGCRTCDVNTPTFSSSSSTKQVAAGQLVSDTVSLAGFAVINQVFAVCDDVSDNLLSSLVSGLMGFAADPSARPEEIGGSLNLGSRNQTLHKGDIDFQVIPDGQETYWIQSLTNLSVQLPATSGPMTYAAIDTGTTLTGGPEDDVIQGIYAQVPGSRALMGGFLRNSEGYYAFPCSQDAQVSMGYGSSSNMWAISPDDFKAFQISETTCVGAVFALDLGGGSESGGNGGTVGVPNWIVGDSFFELVLIDGFCRRFFGLFLWEWLACMVNKWEKGKVREKIEKKYGIKMKDVNGQGERNRRGNITTFAATTGPTQILPVGTEFDLDFEKVESKPGVKRRFNFSLFEMLHNSEKQRAREEKCLLEERSNCVKSWNGGRKREKCVEKEQAWEN